jgi:hypothetical protein
MTESDIMGKLFIITPPMSSIEQSKSLNESDKQFIESQTTLYAKQLNSEIVNKLKFANIASMKNTKVSEILQLENFTKYPYLQKALQRRNQIIDKTNRSTGEKIFYKQILLAKAMLSVALRNM